MVARKKHAGCLDPVQADLRDLEKQVDDPSAEPPFLRREIAQKEDVDIVMLGLCDRAGLKASAREDHALRGAYLAEEYPFPWLPR